MIKPKQKKSGEKQNGKPVVVYTDSESDDDDQEYVLRRESPETSESLNEQSIEQSDVEALVDASSEINDETLSTSDNDISDEAGASSQGREGESVGEESNDSDETEPVRRSGRVRKKPSVFTYDVVGEKPVMRPHR